MHNVTKDLKLEGEKTPLRLLGSDMTVMQTTALKINNILSSGE